MAAAALDPSQVVRVRLSPPRCGTRSATSQASLWLCTPQRPTDSHQSQTGRSGVSTQVSLEEWSNASNHEKVIQESTVGGRVSTCGQFPGAHERDI